MTRRCTCYIVFLCIRLNNILWTRSWFNLQSGTCSSIHRSGFEYELRLRQVPEEIEDDEGWRKSLQPCGFGCRNEKAANVSMGPRECQRAYQRNICICVKLVSFSLLKSMEMSGWDPKWRQSQAYSVTAPHMMQRPLSVKDNCIDLREVT